MSHVRHIRIIEELAPADLAQALVENGYNEFGDFVSTHSITGARFLTFTELELNNSYRRTLTRHQIQALLQFITALNRDATVFLKRVSKLTPPETKSSQQQQNANRTQAQFLHAKASVKQQLEKPKVLPPKPMSLMKPAAILPQVVVVEKQEEHVQEEEEEEEEEEQEEYDVPKCVLNVHNQLLPTKKQQDGSSERKLHAELEQINRIFDNNQTIAAHQRTTSTEEEENLYEPEPLVRDTHITNELQMLMINSNDNQPPQLPHRIPPAAGPSNDYDEQGYLLAVQPPPPALPITSHRPLPQPPEETRRPLPQLPPLQFQLLTNNVPKSQQPIKEQTVLLRNGSQSSSSMMEESKRPLPQLPQPSPPILHKSQPKPPSLERPPPTNITNKSKSPQPPITVNQHFHIKTKQETEQYLLPLPNGSFIFRASKHYPAVLAIKARTRILNIPVIELNRMYYLLTESDDVEIVQFGGLDELVEYYSRNDIMYDGGYIKLLVNQ